MRERERRKGGKISKKERRGQGAMGGAGAHMHKCEYRGASTDFAMFVFLASSD